MTGRRGHCRYGMTNAAATVRVLREVTVQNGTDDEVVAISGEPAVAGDVFILDRIVNHAKLSSRVTRRRQPSGSGERVRPVSASFEAAL